MSDDLADRVLAAIDETERIARAAGAGRLPGGRDWVTAGNEVRTAGGGHLPGTLVVTWSWPAEVEHIAHNDPAATIRRCEADKRTVERHRKVGHSVPFASYEFDYCATCRELMPCPDMLDRAAAYGVEVPVQS